MGAGELGVSQLHTQGPATPSRLHDIITQIKGFFLASKGKGRGTGYFVLGALHPGGNYADACSSCSLGILASCPA